MLHRLFPKFIQCYDFILFLDYVRNMCVMGSKMLQGYDSNVDTKGLNHRFLEDMLVFVNAKKR